MLVLGSQSKARYQLLRLYNAEIEVKSADIDESFVEDKTIEDNVKLLAYKKAMKLLPQIDIVNDILICADTVVVVDNQVLNKPSNYDEAYEMIKSFSNNSVKVITGVYLQHNQDIHNFIDVSTINFEAIDDETIAAYLDDNNNYNEIAGALDIDIIANYIKYSYEGSYSNIIGLPMEKVSKLLYDKKHEHELVFSTPELNPITIYRSSVRSIIMDQDKVILLKGYTFDKQHIFLMSIGGGYHYFENEESVIKKEAVEEGGLIIDNLKHLGYVAEYTENSRYLKYNKQTIHSYYLADVQETTEPCYIEYEIELLLGIEKYSLDEAIELLEQQLRTFKSHAGPVHNMSMCDLEMLKRVKKGKILKIRGNYDEV